MGFSQKGKRIILKTYSNLRARFCLHFFGYQCLILSFDFFFLVKKQGNIGYDTKKNGDAVVSRLRRLLSTIWMKFVPVAPRCLEFCLGVKNLLLNCPKYLTLPNMVKIHQNRFFCCGNIESEVLNFCSEFSVNLLTIFAKLWESQTQKNTKNSDKNFYCSLFSTPRQFLLF